eukprot:152190_1
MMMSLTDENYYNDWNLKSQIKCIQNVEFGDAIPSYKYFRKYYPKYTKYYGILVILFMFITMYLIHHKVLIPMQKYNDISRAKKISVNLYLESCCPNTQDFITNSLAPLWNTDGLKNIVNITISFWGKQQYYYNKTTNIYHYACQHGYNECVGQQLEDCIIHLYPNSNQNIPFVIKLETEMKRMDCQNSTHCTCDIVQLSETLISQTPGNFGMNWNDIENCRNNVTRVNIIEIQESTFTAKTKLNYVPWITVNGKHTPQIQSQCQNSLIDCICEMFRNTNKLYDQACKPQEEFVF